MADRLEERLRRALGELPDSGEEAQARARRAALSALPTSAPAPAPRRTTGILAAAAVLLVGAAVALAGTGQIAVRVGGSPEPEAERRPAGAPEGIPVERPFLPAGAGVAVVVDGRMWLTTAKGLTIAGLAASAATLSPSALYAAAGVGPSLVAVAPDGRRPWTQRTPGPVVAISWAPNPILVAYVTRAAGGYQLRMIEGNGENDRLLARDVAPVAPAWRPDTKAVAFVLADGTTMLWDENTLRARPVAMPTECLGPHMSTRALAFSPAGGPAALLAVLSHRGQLTVTDSSRNGLVDCEALGSGNAVTGLAWVNGSDLVTAERPPRVGVLRRLRVGPSGIRQVGACRARGVGYLAITPAATADRMVVMAAGDPRREALSTRGQMPRRGRVEVWRVPAPGLGGACRSDRTPLLALDGQSARAAWSRPAEVSLTAR